MIRLDTLHKHKDAYAKLSQGDALGTAASLKRRGGASVSSSLRNNWSYQGYRGMRNGGYLGQQQGEGGGSDSNSCSSNVGQERESAGIAQCAGCCLPLPPQRERCSRPLPCPFRIDSALSQASWKQSKTNLTHKRKMLQLLQLLQLPAAKDPKRHQQR